MVSLIIAVSFVNLKPPTSWTYIAADDMLNIFLCFCRKYSLTFHAVSPLETVFHEMSSLFSGKK